MTTVLAEFPSEAALVDGLARVRAEGHVPLDAMTPYPVAELTDAFGPAPARIRPAMLMAGLAAAALAYAVQWWSALFDYPLNSGGRPLHSWPVFLLAPFEVGVLAAAVAGFIAFLRATGLPRLNHPAFDVAGFERASQDRFFLLARSREGASVRTCLEDAGASVVSELRP